MIKRILLSVINRLERFFVLIQEFIEKLDFKYKLVVHKVNKVSYVNIEDVATKIMVFKEATEEIIEMPCVYNFIKQGETTIYYPEIALWEFKNATVYYNSDFISTNNEQIVWPKKDYYNFSKNIPKDSFIYDYNYKHAYINKPKEIEEYDYVLPLTGVHSQVWSHALCEYLPRLYQIRKIIDKIPGQLTVLVPDYGTSHIKDIVYEELHKYDIDIKELKFMTAVKANHLYFMERTGRVTDHEIYCEIGDQVIPKIVTDIWKKEVTFPLTKKYVANNSTPSLKLYLARRTGGHRMITNNDEIETYFKKRGYVFVEPHKISLEEVVKLFYNAKVVAGPFSSAFTNLIFSRPGTRALVLSNFTRTFETFLEPIQQYFNVRIDWFIGYDIDKQHPGHCSFYIPIEKMEKAIKELSIE